jgi:hypothetical protein
MNRFFIIVDGSGTSVEHAEGALNELSHFLFSGKTLGKTLGKPLTRPHVRRKLIPSSMIRHPSTRERDMRRIYLPSKEKKSRFQCRAVVRLFDLPDFFQEKRAKSIEP